MSKTNETLAGIKKSLAYVKAPPANRQEVDSALAAIAEVEQEAHQIDMKFEEVMAAPLAEAAQAASDLRKQVIEYLPRARAAYEALINAGPRITEELEKRLEEAKAEAIQKVKQTEKALEKLGFEQVGNKFSLQNPAWRSDEPNSFTGIIQPLQSVGISRNLIACCHPAALAIQEAESAASGVHKRVQKWIDAAQARLAEVDDLEAETKRRML